MTLEDILLKELEISKCSWGYDCEILDYFPKFFKENPRFKDAIIIASEIEDNFNCYYDYDEHCWLVELKGKKYNVIIHSGHRRYSTDRKSKPGVRFSRVFQEGEKRIRRRRRLDYHWEPMWKSVQGAENGKFKNDCQIWTIAKCLNISYMDAWKELSTQGWTETRVGNPWLNRYTEIFEKYGFNFREMWKRWKNEKGSTLANITKNLIPKSGTFVVTTRNHILCVIDGIIYDSAFKPGSHVDHIWEITPKN